MGYSTRVIKGIGWTSLLQMALKGTSLIKFIIIAKLLSPSEFGIFGIALITIAFFQAMTEAGISSYLIQLDKKEEEYVSSAWIVSIARGILIFILTAIVAYPVSLFFNAKSSLQIIFLAGIIPLLNGFENPSVAKFQKNLEFNKEFAFRIPIAVFDLLSSAILIFIYQSSLALIFALILTALFETFLSFIFIKPRPLFIIDLEKLKKIFHFGKWITLVSGMNYFVTKIDSIVVGRLLGVELLGIYEMAQKFSLQLMSDVGYVFTKVTFPLFSRIKIDIPRTKRAFRRILILALPLFGIITLVMVVFSKEIIMLFAGVKWADANIPLKLLALSGFVSAIISIITSLFLAHARQDITAKIVLARLLIIAIMIIPACLYFGIIGASSVTFISYFLVIPLGFYGLKIIYKE